MSHKLNYRERFLQQHPNCAFCGSAATTIEHCPPKALFQDRAWPEGFEFPACNECNQGTADHDVVVAMLARMDPISDSGSKDGRQIGYMKNANANFPQLFREMIPNAVEARRFNRSMGIVPGPGQTHQEVCPVKVPNDVNDAVQTFAGKLAKAIFYMKSGLVFPNDGSLALNWFTNADLFREGKYPVFELLKDMAGEVPSLSRARTDLSSQFQIKWSADSEGNFFVLQAKFGNSFGFVVVGSAKAGWLEGLFERLEKKAGRKGPFSFLQATGWQSPGRSNSS